MKVTAKSVTETSLEVLFPLYSIHCVGNKVNKLRRIRGEQSVTLVPHRGYLKFRLNEAPRVDVWWSCSRSLDVLP